VGGEKGKNTLELELPQSYGGKGGGQRERAFSSTESVGEEEKLGKNCTSPRKKSSEYQRQTSRKVEKTAGSGEKRLCVRGVTSSTRRNETPKKRSTVTLAAHPGKNKRNRAKKRKSNPDAESAPHQPKGKW